MSQKIEISDLPKSITGSVVRKNKVVLCDYCNGFGFRETEELSDYHKREYTTYRSKCSKCEGDGRLIEATEQIKLNLDKDRVSIMPYISFSEFVDPHFHDTRWCRWRLDMTDRELERKYPELAAISYDKYDELVEKYRLIEILKKEENV